MSSEFFFVAQIESPEVGGCFLECLVAEAGWKFLYSLAVEQFAPEKLPGPKRRIVFQPSFFGGYVTVLDFRAVFSLFKVSESRKELGWFCYIRAYIIILVGPA